MSTWLKSCSLRATLYQQAGAGELTRLIMLMKEARAIINQSTGTTVPETGTLIQNMENAASNQSEEAEAYGFWKGLTFKDLCIRTGRSYEYILMLLSFIALGMLTGVHSLKIENYFDIFFYLSSQCFWKFPNFIYKSSIINCS
jgi:hypothetical protein